MDSETLRSLAVLLRAQRVASLGTLRDGAPLVTMVLYALEPDFSGLYLHLSHLAHHTWALTSEARMSLMIAEPDDDSKDPQLLMRVSIQGEAKPIPKGTGGWDGARSLYLNRFPTAATMFGLGDFDLYRVEPQAIRFVAGFGQAYNLTAGHLREAAGLE